MEISDTEARVIYKALKHDDLCLHELAILFDVKERLSKVANDSKQ